MALSVSRLIRVVINLSPLAAARRSFGVLMVAGDSNVINGLERFRTYTTLEGVAEDFGTSAPEYGAAALYFGQTPKPRTIMIGRWLRTATAGFNIGGALSAAEQTLTQWNVITNGGFVIPIDGSNVTLSSLDFSAQTNLNGVATVITSGLSGAGVCTWNGSQFVITSNTTGDGAYATGSITLDTNPSYGAQASSTIELTGQPSPADTVTIQGTVVTFVAGSPTGNQVLIGGSVAATATNLQNFLAASANANLALMTYNTLGLITTITARIYGTAGNSYTLAKSGSNITISGGVFTGGVAADTLTVNGTVCTFVASGATGNQILVGPTVEATSANLQGFLQSSANANIDDATYATEDLVTTVTYGVPGTAGNGFTLAKSSTHITLSGGVLSGGATPSSVGYATAGSGTDLAPLLKMTSALSSGLVGGYDAETPVECAAALANKSAAWYGLMFQASIQPTDEQSLTVSALIEGLSIKRVYGVTITNTNVLSALVSNDLASLMKAAGYKQSFCQYSSSSVYAIASLFGRMFSVDFNANRSTITLMYKQEPGVTGEELDETEAGVLKDKRCNVFANYVNDTLIVQYGVMSGSAYIDEIHGLDWFQDAVQNNCYNVLYTSKTKIPQTDAGANTLSNAISSACEEATNNGLVAPGIWNADGFGQLERGQYLKDGYYIYATPMALQSQAEREARVAPPIQVAVKLAGAIQEMDVLIDVNR